MLVSKPQVEGYREGVDRDGQTMQIIIYGAGNVEMEAKDK
jgi:hypothetical protein